MNKLDLAEALIAIADSGSIQQAASKLHQTNAAISKKLAKLEAHLATQLIQRQRKGMILTEAGQRYYHEAKKALAQFNLAEEVVTQSRIHPRGELKVVSNCYYAENYILPELPHFLACYPDILLTLEVAEILPNFNAKKMDILFGVSVAGELHLVQKRIDTTRYVLCASPQYLTQKGTPQSSIELLQHDFIGHSMRKTQNVIMLDQDKQILIKPKLLFNNTQLMIQAAVADLGFIWTHENIVSDFLINKKLIRILDNLTRQPITVYAYYEQQQYSNPKIQAFMKIFAK
jgi:DNA-binding transcriptional LysR family regulator